MCVKGRNCSLCNTQSEMIWEGMWWGPREKFMIWVHGTRICVRLMGLHFSNILLLLTLNF